MKKGSKVRRICLCVCACAAAIALVAVAACAEDMTVHEFCDDDVATFNDGMSNISTYEGDYTVGLTKTEQSVSWNKKGTKVTYTTTYQDGFIFSHNAVTYNDDGSTKADDSDNRVIVKSFETPYENGTAKDTTETGLYFKSRDSVYDQDGKEVTGTPTFVDNKTISYDTFTGLSWLPQLLVQKDAVDTVSKAEDVTDFILTMVSGVGALEGVDTSDIKSENLVVESNQYCEEFTLTGNVIAYEMQFATTEASSTGATYPSFTYLKVEVTSQDKVTTIECYVSFDYATTAWSSNVV
ncbi:MAG: hypothetical protein LUE27_08960 [Clostridia bacterium]|nr:hypothetical protein [Clostridia bacterium]